MGCIYIDKQLTVEFLSSTNNDETRKLKRKVIQHVIFEHTLIFTCHFLPITLFRFVCQFNIEGRVTSVNAQLLSDTIYCDEMEFTYTSRAPNVTATFAVIWGQSKPLDNPDNIHVLIYRCKEMANNCGMCLSLDAKYQCGWCQVNRYFFLENIFPAKVLSFPNLEHFES